MKNTLTASTLHRIKIYKPRVLVILMPILLLSFFSQITIAQDEETGSAPAVSIPPIPPNIMEYLKGKYNKVDEDGVNARLQQTPHGPLGHIIIRGKDITPKAGRNIPQLEAMSKEDRARAMAMAFIAEEVSLLGITNLNELREFKFKITEYGDTLINYHRYISDLRLDEVEINIGIGQNGNIDWVSADVLPFSPEVYEAVAKETLKESDIRSIIERDLRSTARNPKEKAPIIMTELNMDIKKVAIQKPPYVIWKVAAGTRIYAWDYRIDAFTGEILEKRDARQFIR